MFYRYILLVYDQESDIQKMHSLDLFEKKYEACAYAGFKLSKSKDGYYRFDERVNNMVLGKEDCLVDAISAFLAYQNRPKWNYLIFLTESMLSFTRDAIGRKNRDAKTSKEYRALYDDYHKLSSEVGRVFDETKDFVRRFYYNIEKDRSSVRPEDYAERLEGGDDLRSDNPYGVNYVVDSIKFLGDDEDKV